MEETKKKTRNRADTLPTSFQFNIDLSSKELPKQDENNELKFGSLFLEKELPLIQKTRVRGATISLNNPFLNLNENFDQQININDGNSDSYSPWSHNILNSTTPTKFEENKTAPVSTKLEKLKQNRNRSQSFNLSNFNPEITKVLNNQNPTVNNTILTPTKSRIRSKTVSIGGLKSMEENTDLILDEEEFVNKSIIIYNIDSSYYNNNKDYINSIVSKFGVLESPLKYQNNILVANYLNLDSAIKAHTDLQNFYLNNNLNLIVKFNNQTDNYLMDSNQVTRSIWIGNISASTSSAMLNKIFSKYGKIESSRILPHKNCGFVNFFKESDAINAKLQMNNKELSGSIIKIGFAKVHLNKINSSDVIYNDNNNVSLEDYIKFDEDGNLYGLEEKFINDTYLNISPINNNMIMLDNVKLKEIKKRLELINFKETDSIYFEIKDFIVELCSDYIGNTIIQKFVEKCTNLQRLEIINKIGYDVASIGCHKNGTWAIQKLIDTISSDSEIELLINFIKPFIPSLLLDQFGNYVVQCCLKFGQYKKNDVPFNTFIFECIHGRFYDIALGRFGARAIRTCLESKFCNVNQQLLVTKAILHYCLELMLDMNGTILITWLLDSSNFKNKYSLIVKKISKNTNVLTSLCCHKLAHLTLLKIINQRVEPLAKKELIKLIFFNGDNNLKIIIKDQLYGFGLIQKIMISSCLTEKEKLEINNVVNMIGL